MAHPGLRVGHHERDQVVEHVKAAYADGRLDKDEMDERLHRAMTARTHADLAPILADLYGPRVDYAPRPPQPGCGPDVAGTGDRLAGGMAHLLSLFGFFVIGPLIVLLAGRSSPFIRKQAAEALNFHLTMLGGSLALMFTVVGVFLLPFLWIVGIVLSVVAGVSALAGGHFRYPLTVRLVK
ncbi:hypothetical protein Pth03_31740 [Planotetraspora thailandica]|uniref:DUF1707 domain-containing protein n=1 Tax=Planotetraspora thailandica TaxID=487172 RepID=A0A8J3XWA8_9ACTN|nr:DUF1707 and DUF4870 domain-containing protein [Planotetraspora thailandica]GII54785.1 hypothetical protein Pth03_31740 [Planotetraspora thailandica]